MPDLTAHQRALLRWFPTIADTGADWREQALCAQHNPEQWFPDQIGNHPDPAAQICRQCPVRTQCLEYAITNNEMHGIWGGMTAQQRQNISDRRSTQVSHCGQGHEFTAENTIVKQGFRRCRTCLNGWARDYQRDRRERGLS